MVAERKLSDEEIYNITRILCAEYSFLMDMEGDKINLGMYILGCDIEDLHKKMNTCRKKLIRLLRYEKNHKILRSGLKKISMRFSYRIANYELEYTNIEGKKLLEEFGKKSLIFSTIRKQLIGTKYLPNI